MLRPEPYTCRCQVCHWHKTFAPQSDALSPGDDVSRCPNCLSEALRKEPATGMDRVLATLKRRLQRPTW